MLSLDIDDNILMDIQEASSRDIAIIGIDVNLPRAGTLHDFWDNLKNERDCIAELSMERKQDIIAYLSHLGQTKESIRFAKGGYIEEIDKFDYEFFKIPYNEARLMDPNQRIFLQNVWKAIEDAGYGNGKLSGSNTGVYVGFTPGNEYSQYIKQIDHTLLPFSETGNLSSIVAARISYLLDLKGPSMIVNTECSSSIVALHLACQSLRNHEIDMALVGGVKVSFCPTFTEDTIGVESENEKVRSFDDDADGSVFGEGSVALVIKRYDEAVSDRDNIYAIIKGSKINQDGASVGITAPNVKAQENLLVDAWNDAGVAPESISYIETHGTGTRLGDPIEIKAIDSAFKRFTKKRQFCGVGSVKTNISHLDNVSGLASLVKAILSLQKKQIPASLHFQCPNRQIQFEESAVYVNNKLSNWNVEGKRRCGVSSFGLSGTNSHIVLEEAEESAGNEGTRYPVFTISANRREQLMALIQEVIDDLNGNPEKKFGDICYTMNTGHGDYLCRLAILADSSDELKECLIKIREQGLEGIHSDVIYWAEHRVVSDKNTYHGPGEITFSDKEKLSIEAKEIVEQLHEAEASDKDMLAKLCSLYIEGAEVDWELLYENEVHWRVSLPTCQFAKKRCWLEITEDEKEETLQYLHHPLLDTMRADEEKAVYQFSTEFRVNRQWVLEEHKIFDRYLVPGTSYLEMVREAMSHIEKSKSIEFRNVIYISSLVLTEDESLQACLKLVRKEDCYGFTVGCLEEGGEWKQVYCEGTVAPRDVMCEQSIWLDEIKNRVKEPVSFETNQPKQSKIRLGERWSTLIQKVYHFENEILVKMVLPERYKEDLEEYYIHPSLYDIGINAISQNIGKDVYLPFSYERLLVYKRTPQVVYSYVKKAEQENNDETITCNIMMFQENGELFAEVKNFVAKKVKAPERKYSYGISYRECKETSLKELSSQNKRILVIANKSQRCTDIINSLRETGKDIVVVYSNGSFQKISQNEYWIEENALCYYQLFEELKENPVDQIIHLQSNHEENRERTLKEHLEHGVYSLFHIAKALLDTGWKKKTELIVVSSYVKRVLESQTDVHEYNACMYGFISVLGKELSNISCRFIDIDNMQTLNDFNLLKHVVFSEKQHQYIALRNGRLYNEVLGQIELNSVDGASAVIKENGVYVITGGMGSLGIRIAQCISSLKKVHLVILGRRTMEELEAIAQNSEENGIRENLAIYRAIEATESTVEYYSADIADKKEMEAVLQEISRRHGQINGIVHAAGIVKDSLFKNKTFESFKEVLKAKVYGTWVLRETMRDYVIDFMVCFSSVSSLYGFPGQSDYAAANAYLDASAGIYGDTKVIAINWAPWKDAGMAKENKVEDNGVFRLISSQDALEAFQRVLGSEYSNVMISEINESVLKQYYNPEEMLFEESIMERIQPKQSKDTTNQKTLSQSGYTSSVVSELLKIWRKVLGIEKIDIYESFLSLGGDSIQAVALMKAVEQKYPNTVNVSDIFQYQSVSELADYIKSRLGISEEEPAQGDLKKKERRDFLVGILKQLSEGRITIEEADTLMDDSTK